ncbi:hypothetical protein KSP39_PZI005485 [Platanthera zijinensis]|uniref:AT-hook motif nuclear-localized protein n=1 Tax=Platanthera zijinensis TaxID=2320716 RepID=A0AAP0GAU3_9ASPA
MPNENGGTKSRSGGMSISLAMLVSHGRVVGGGVAGLFVGASPVQYFVLPWKRVLLFLLLHPLLLFLLLIPASAPSVIVKNKKFQSLASNLFQQS